MTINASGVMLHTNIYLTYLFKLNTVQHVPLIIPRGCFKLRKIRLTLSIQEVMLNLNCYSYKLSQVMKFFFKACK